MAFSYRLVLSPYGQEELYRRMVAAGVTSLHTFIIAVLLEAAQQDDVVERALALAHQLQEAKTGNAKRPIHDS